jgi:membrane dipeptidase
MATMTAKERAAKLYAKALVWDDHSGFEPHPKAELANLRRWKDAGVHYLSVDVGYDVIDWRTSLATLAAFRTWIQKHPEDYRLVKTVADIRKARRDGKLAIAFDLEGMNALDGDVNMVGAYHELGVRQMLFAYNLNNKAGGGCHDQDVGLTPFGREVIAEMNRVGMIVDCSHTSYRTTMEAMEASADPVIFSHSCAKALRRHGRNITDEQIRACARTGGVVGVTGIGIFLGANDVSSATFVDHIAHMAELVGPEHVGIALDYAFEVEGLDGLTTANPAYWPPEEYGVKGVKFVPPEQLPEITETMVARGFKDREILGILGGNFLRVASRVWK